MSFKVTPNNDIFLLQDQQYTSKEDKNDGIKMHPKIPVHTLCKASIFADVIKAILI